MLNFSPSVKVYFPGAKIVLRALQLTFKKLFLCMKLYIKTSINMTIIGQHNIYHFIYTYVSIYIFYIYVYISTYFFLFILMLFVTAISTK